MSGLFSAPKPPAIEEPVDNTEEEERKERLEAMARRRRGRADTVKTGPRGLMAEADWTPQKKQLLGE